MQELWLPTILIMQKCQEDWIKRKGS
jgi:hypothetical protein